jgi:hypothetical protein
MQLLISSPDKGKRAAKRFETLEKKIGGSVAMMAEVAEVVSKKNKDNWAKGVQLQPKTVEYKEKYGESSEPLVETGRMKDELTTAEKGTKRLRSYELVWGSNSLVEKGGVTIPLAKAYLLQHGSKHQKKHKVLKVTPVTRRLVSEVIMRHITED